MFRNEALKLIKRVDKTQPCESVPHASSMLIKRSHSTIANCSTRPPMRHRCRGGGVPPPNVVYSLSVYASMDPEQPCHGMQPMPNTGHRTGDRIDVTIMMVKKIESRKRRNDGLSEVTAPPIGAESLVAQRNRTSRRMHVR